MDRGAAEDAQRFVEKWSRAELTERAASHEHFLDLCRLLGRPTRHRRGNTTSCNICK